MGWPVRHSCASETLIRPETTGPNRTGFGLFMRRTALARETDQIREIPVLERMGYA
jgi:hypothetical protein